VLLAVGSSCLVKLVMQGREEDGGHMGVVRHVSNMTPRPLSALSSDSCACAGLAIVALWFVSLVLQSWQHVHASQVETPHEVFVRQHMPAP
jgi:hypothetical protein